MLLTNDEILTAFPWSPPRHVSTSRGDRLLRTCPSTSDLLGFYNDNRATLASRGIVHGLKRGTTQVWEFCWWGQIPVEDVKKRDDSLALSMAVDHSEDVPTPHGMALRGYQRAGVHFALARHGTLIGDEMGLGKEMPLNMPVLTPDGWKPIGDLKVGDRVTGLDGWAQSVEGVFPQGKKRAYLVEFSDGTSVECGLEHLWSVQNLNGTSRGRSFHVLPLSQIMQRLHESWEVPVMAAAVFNQNQPLPIPPYLLGVILGDGAMKAPGITFVPGDQMVPEEVAKVIPPTMELRRNADYGSSTRYSVCCLPRKKVHPFAEWIREKGLNVTGEHKFIPSIYLFSSYDNRRDLLRGLMDTDGTSSGARLRFQTTSPRLADDVAHLVRSMGGIASTSRYQPKREKELPLYTVCFCGIGNPFTRRTVDLPKKQIRKVIKKVTPMDEVEQVCIRVSNPDHLYVTRNFIVTHNTAQVIGMLNMREKWRDILIICPNRVRLNWIREIDRFMLHDRSVGLVEDGLFPRSEIVVIHYEILSKFEVQFSKRLWDLVVIDECHRLKDSKTKRAQAVFGARPTAEEKRNGKLKTSGIPCRNRVALSGTPIPNRPREIFPIINWLDPVNWGNQWKFLNDYCFDQRVGFNGGKNLSELQKKLRETCFVAGTMIDTLNGPREISHIVRGRIRHKVWARDSFGNLTIRQIVGFSETSYQGILVKVRHEAGSFICTRDHSVFTLEGEKSAGSLAKGDSLLFLLRPRIETSRILSVETLEVGCGRESCRGCGRCSSVFDLEVEEDHNFFANGVLVHNCMIRRMKRDVATEIPPKVRHLVMLPATTDEARRALRSEREACGGDLTRLDTILKPDAFEGSAAAKIQASLRIPFERMSQIRHDTAVAKVSIALDFIVDLLEDCQKLVVFAHHRDVLSMLYVGLRKFGAVLVMGGTDIVTTEGLKTRFMNDPETRVFIGSLLATGTGLDGLQTACSTSVFVEDDWVPGNIDQAEGRLCRIGQSETVNSYHLVLEGSIDGRVISFIINKGLIISAALDTFDPVKQLTPTVDVPQPGPSLFGKRVSRELLEASQSQNDLPFR